MKAKFPQSARLAPTIAMLSVAILQLAGREHDHGGGNAAERSHLQGNGFCNADGFCVCAGRGSYAINYTPSPSSARRVWSSGYDVSLTR